MVRLADLPKPERRAWAEREAARTGLKPGVYDGTAHAAFLEAPASMRAAAERKAAIARLLLTEGAGLSWADRVSLVAERLGSAGVSKATLRRILAAVEGVDPINHAPALLAGHGTAAPAPAAMSDDAWRLFRGLIRDAGAEWPLRQAWRDVRDVKARFGWDWPSYETVVRRWHALPTAERLALRHGTEAAVKALAQPVRRDKTSIAPLDWVSLDGRTLDFWVDWGDGRERRPVMLALVDVASDVVLGWELAESENAAATLRLLCRTVERHGIFDRLYTDNGSAFAGHVVAGGAVHKFRRRNRDERRPEPPGACRHLGIELTFALPGRGQSKAAERTFATLSRAIDDRPEFKGAHAGHAPGASPGPGVRSVPVAEALRIIEREVGRHNREPGRRSQGARGRSYEAVFKAGLKGRATRRATAAQLRLAGLVYKPAAVDRHGQVTVGGWTYGGPDTQDALLRHHKRDRIWIGQDPADLSAPAVAFDPATGRCICPRLEAIVPGAYGSLDGARTAARNAKAVRAAIAAAERAQETASDAELHAALAALDGGGPDPAPQPARKVVAGRFGAPLRARPAAEPGERPGEAVPAEFYRNMDRKLGLRGPGGGAA